MPFLLPKLNRFMRFEQDSLSSIAKRHGVNIRDVMRWNSDTDNLRPGDQLTLFVKNSDRPES
ncbi:membrane-bound lytic murein transglycosylase D [Klebsiella pneumoniae]|uniref:Membrane-bound lytic murein transglycosylase D n=1 Tax=Klebsiella pneumoniae TaxID=573 RepID=A0A378AW77_KLEPN|nr:membrane-bound lytic murein transglycosylase D [Klebsiella pneumoniae]